MEIYMKLTTKNIELKLITKLLTNIRNNGCFITNIEILGVYIYGSRLWNNDNENSDLDYCIIILDNSSLWKNIETNNQYFQIESDDIDFHIMSETYYKDLVQKCDEMALSLYFQDNPLLKYHYSTELNLQNLRISFSTKSNNSYVKSKKKLTVEDNTNKNLKLAYKSMFHSLRILSFGIDIANFIIKNSKIYLNQSSKYSSFYNSMDIETIKFDFENNSWENLHKIYKPIFNELSSTFKKLAPKN